MRDVKLDVLRVLACVMIVLMHSPMPGLNTPGAVLSGLSYLTAPGIGLFFMVSGSLLLKRNKNGIFGTRGFLKRRFSKILIPLIFWSLVGFLLEKNGVENTELSILWFMYCLAGIYLLTPILSRWLNGASIHEVEFYLFLWLLTLFVPFAKIFFPVNESDTSWLYYFHGYVGYFVLGYYLQNYSDEKESIIRKMGLVVMTIIILISVAIPMAFFMLKVEVNFYSLFWYLSITVALQCIVWWSVVKRLMKNVANLPRFVVELSKLSFGIYLIHILVMRNILWETTWMQNMHGIVQIVVCTILTFTISALISWGISKVQYVRTIIGY